jgi:hypothetical protein
VTDTPGLEKQYDRVLQEYRFQVQLNWDRAKHYLVLKAIAVVAGVSGLAAFVAALFYGANP